MRETSRVTGASKGRHKGDVTEGAGAREQFLPSEFAIQAAVHLMRFLH